MTAIRLKNKNVISRFTLKLNLKIFFVQSAGGVEYPHQWVFWIWHKTIWWWSSCDAGALGNVEKTFIAIAPRSTLARKRSIWEGPIYGLNKTNCILMLNWIVWIRTVWLNWIAKIEMFLTIKLYLHLNSVLMLNWIVWNGTVFDIDTLLTLNWINIEFFDI